MFKPSSLETGHTLDPQVAFLNSVFLFAGIVAFGMGFYRWQISVVMGLIDFVFSLCAFALVYYLNRHKEHVATISSIALGLAYGLFTAVYLLAPYNVTRVSLFFLLLAAAFFLKGRKAGLVWLIFILLTLAIGHFLPGFDTAYSPIDIVTTSLYLMALLFIFLNYEKFKEQLYEQEKRLAADAATVELEQKRAAALAQLNAELEQRVRQRTAELEQKAGELQHSESQLRVTLESLAEGLIELDAEGRVLLMNPEAERLLRWSGQEMRGKPVSELVRLCDAQGQSLPTQASCIERALQWGEVSRDEEQWLQRSDGSRFLAAMIASPIVGEGRVKGVVASFQDISERKLAEHLRNELIARISHELRTPLAGIQGAAELLRSKKDMAAPKREQLLEIIASDSGRLGALVENFTELRRHLAGEVRYRFEPLAMPPLLQAAIERAAKGDMQHRFHLEAPDTLPAIPADAPGIHRVLDNLLSNAVKFSPQGGDITLAARAADGELQVSVRDQGVGIAPEALPKLFTPLFQAEATDTRRFGGAGLGLAMVKVIVEAHGGRVWAESELGQGSTFYFTLPISPPPPPA